uniref:Ribosomal protein L20 n=1 Tax=Kappaphycus striatus TaxID=88410 RepID=A0A059T1W7_9FLOR|nr:ribosomal protein L20 [Kappaphycus striatus]AHG98616.1 ribosomal protein L20 [Kappaphycus striatus]
MMLNFESKKELDQYKTRKTKRCTLNDENLPRVNYSNYFIYSNFSRFLSKEKLLLNKSIVMNFINTESGSLYVLRKWCDNFFHRLYW